MTMNVNKFEIYWPTLKKCLMQNLCWSANYFWNNFGTQTCNGLRPIWQNASFHTHLIYYVFYSILLINVAPCSYKVLWSFICLSWFKFHLLLYKLSLLLSWLLIGNTISYRKLDCWLFRRQIWNCVAMQSICSGLKYCAC